MYAIVVFVYLLRNLVITIVGYTLSELGMLQSLMYSWVLRQKSVTKRKKDLLRFLYHTKYRLA